MAPATLLDIGITLQQCFCEIEESRVPVLLMSDEVNSSASRANAR